MTVSVILAGLLFDWGGLLAAGALSSLAIGGLILADNMSQPKPSPDFVKAITTNPNLETVFLNMQSTGLGVTLKKH